MQRARQRFADLGSYDDPTSEPMLLDDHEIAAGWDADIDRLLTEAIESRSGDQLVELPAQLSTTAVLRLNADPDAFAAELARPMPRQPSRSARFGTRFHHWVERYFGAGLPTGGLGQQQLLDLDDLPNRADSGTHDEQELRELCEAFAAGRFGSTVPYAIEAPFSIWIAGRLVRGRIDAVYQQPTSFRIRRGQIPSSGLEDRSDRYRRSAAARHLPAGLGRGVRAACRGNRRNLLSRTHR